MYDYIDLFIMEDASRAILRCRQCGDQVFCWDQENHEYLHDVIRALLTTIRRMEGK